MSKEYGEKPRKNIMGTVQIRRREDVWSGDFYNSKGEWLRRVTPFPVEGFDESRPAAHIGAGGLLWHLVVVS